MKVFVVIACLVALALADEADYYSTKKFLEELSGEEVNAILDELRLTNNGQLTPVVQQVIIDHPELLAPSYPANEPLLEFEGSEKLSQKSLIKITHTVQDIKRRQEISKKNFVPRKVSSKRRGKPCIVDDDCPYMEYCTSMEDRVKENLEKHNSSNYLNFTKKRLDVDSGNECVKRLDQFMRTDGAKSLPAIHRAHYRIVQLTDRVGERNETGFKNFAKTFEFVKSYNMTTEFDEPTARHGEISTYGGGYSSGGMGGGIDIMTLLLFSGLLDGDGGDGGFDISTFLLISMLGGDGGAGGGIMQNPLFLLVLLGEDGGLFGGDGDGDIDFMTLILLTQLGGGGGADMYMLPLMLGLLGGDSDGDDDMMSSLMPLLLLGNIGGGQCQGGGSGQASLMQFLLYSSLLGGDGFDDSMLMFLLVGGNGCGAGGGMLEIILLLDLFDSDGGGGLGDMDPLLLLLLLGGLGSGGGGLDSSLLLLALSGGMNISELIPFLLLTDGRFMENPLMLLLIFGDLFDGDLFGGDSLGTLLIVSLLFSGGDTGYTGQQVYTQSSVGVSQQYTGIPPPGQALYGGGTYTTGTSGGHSSGGGGMFGGLLGGFQGNGLFEYFMLMTLLGGGDGDDNFLTMFLLLSMLGGGNNSLFGGSTGGGYGDQYGNQYGHTHHTHQTYQQGTVYGGGQQVVGQQQPQGYVQMQGGYDLTG